MAGVLLAPASPCRGKPPSRTASPSCSRWCPALREETPAAVGKVLLVGWLPLARRNCPAEQRLLPTITSAWVSSVKRLPPCFLGRGWVVGNGGWGGRGDSWCASEA